MEWSGEDRIGVEGSGAAGMEGKNMKHELKVWPVSFAKIRAGWKRYAFTEGNLKIESGDEVVFKEFDPGSQTWTGRKLTGYVKNPNLFKSEDSDLVIFTFDLDKEAP